MLGTLRATRCEGNQRNQAHWVLEQFWRKDRSWRGGLGDEARGRGWETRCCPVPLGEPGAPPCMPLVPMASVSCLRAPYGVPSSTSGELNSGFCCAHPGVWEPLDRVLRAAQGTAVSRAAKAEAVVCCLL